MAKKMKNAFEKHLTTPKKYLRSDTWSYVIICCILCAIFVGIVLFCGNKVYSYFFEPAEEKMAKAIIESNSKQFTAKIHGNIPTNKPLITDGRIIFNIVVENIGQENDFPIPPSKIISQLDGLEEYSSLVVKFLNPQKNILGEPKRYPVTASPIRPGEKSTEIIVDEILPQDTSSIEITLDCEYINQSRPCKKPKVERLIYESIYYLKVLVVDASRTTDSINVPSFRSEVNNIYGNSNFLKAAASFDPVGPSYMKGPMLLYGKNYKPDSEITKQLQAALQKIYKQKNYITSVYEMTPHNLEIGYTHLSDSVKDGDNESDHQWVNLDIKKNRFSPNIFIKNSDKIDFVIFLPSNTYK